MITTEIIKTATLEYQSDISWSYSVEMQRIAIDFYKDESGRNHLEQFCQKVRNVWVDIIPTDAQIKLMWKMLDDTHYKTVEERFTDIEDEYLYNGVKREDFY